ncbi:PKD domain-containing protein [Candidatus Woesearchaeota archaeon]|nr:PKD domain-containing protein [Candidatus Woesearchaeota archaeon]
MMKKIMFWTFAIISLIVTIVGAMATTDITYNYFEQTTNNDLNNVRTQVYTCLDDDCENTSTTFFFDANSGSGNTQTVPYPTNLVSPFGYARFSLRLGYVPMEGRAYWHCIGGNDCSEDYNVEFYKLDNCSATIDNFSVTNSVEAFNPLIVNVSAALDARTHSALTQTFDDVRFIPLDQSIRDEYYSARTRIDLEIINQNTGAIVHSDNTELYIFADDSENVHFSWTPVIEGDYTARVTSTVIDAKCSSDVPLYSQKYFDVYPRQPQGECYTLLNNLQTDDPTLQVNQSIVVSAQKISNYVDNNSVYTPIQTQTYFEVFDENSVLVDSQPALLVANNNSFLSESFSFDWTPQNAGVHLLRISAKGLCFSGINQTEDMIEQTIFVNGVFINDTNQTNDTTANYTVTFQARDSTTAQILQGVAINVDSTQLMTDSSGQVSIELTPNNYTYIAALVGYVPRTATFEVTDNDMTVMFTLSTVNTPPQLFGLPDLYLTENITPPVSLIDLWSYAIDNEQSDDQLTFSITSQTNTGVVNCFITSNRYINCNIPTVQGTTDITVQTTDGQYTASDTFTVFVNQTLPPVIDTQPNLTISASPDNGTVPLFVQFNSVVVAGETPFIYFWDFGDDIGISTQANPTYNYTTVGNYTVTAIVFDVDGDNDTATLTVTVNPSTIIDTQPILTITANPDNGTEPLFVQFNSAVIGGEAPYTYSWNFGDGTTSSLASPTNNYTTPGIYTVMATVTDTDGDIDTEILTITVNQIIPSDTVPTVTINANPQTGQAPLPVQFNLSIVGGEAPYTYSWNFGDNITSNLQSLAHTYIFSGVYTATVTVTDADGDTDTDSILISANLLDQPATAQIIATPKSGVAPLTIDFEAVGSGDLPLNYVWDFDDGTAATGQFTQHDFSDAGRYTVTLTVIDADGDMATDTTTIRVGEEPLYKPTDILKLNRLSVVSGEFYKPGDAIATFVSFENTFGDDLEDVKITLAVPQLGIFRTVGTFDVDEGKTLNKRAVLNIPRDAKTGNYEIRIVISDGTLRRVKHRFITII